MVYEKYIKRGGKKFGPYLYENYRENGETKTRYLGKGRKEVNWKRYFIITGVFLLIILFILGISYNFRDKDSEFEGELENTLSLSFLKNFLGSQPLSAFVRVVKDTPPEIKGLNEIFVCEGDEIDEELRVTDEENNWVEFDEQPPTSELDLYFFPPIFHAPKSENWEKSDLIELTSKIVKYNAIEGVREEVCGDDKCGWAVYEKDIFATQKNDKKSSIHVYITVIEVNNKPEFEIGTKTIYTKGEDRVFEKDLGGELNESGEETPISELIFNISEFEISDEGIINIIGNESMISEGNESEQYDIEVCVNDSDFEDLGIKEHEDFGDYCEAYYPYAQGYCDDFELTVTKENRAPIITDYFNESLNLSVKGEEGLYFNATAYDKDWSSLDFIWYVDGEENRYNEGVEYNGSDEFEHAFECGIGGEHNISLIVTDGLENDSVVWNVSVEKVGCSKPPEDGGGGGGGGKVYCEEKWGCEDWSQCSNLFEMSKKGWIKGDEYLLIKQRCEDKEWDKEICGYQVRDCEDFNDCNSEFNKPGFLRECYYTENPNCSDDIRNCHDGSCEIGIDCGGPCEACPTCSDRIQNQGEEDVDCGGPCEPCKEYPMAPVIFKSVISYLLIALFSLLMIFLVVQVFKHKKFKKIVKDYKNMRRFVFIFLVFIALFFANMYIMNLSEQGSVKIKEGDKGFMYSQSALNFINKGIAEVMMLDILNYVKEEKGNLKLVIWDELEIEGAEDKYTVCDEYCDRKSKGSSQWNMEFYANYTNISTGGAVGGDCEIRFNESGFGEWRNMSYDDDEKMWKYTNNFSYNGNLEFEVNCSNEGENLTTEKEFIITNTVPYIPITANQYIDFNGDYNKDSLVCQEDGVCQYNFSNNVSEDDLNDVLSYRYEKENTTLTDFVFNETTGMLEINITKSEDTGIKEIGLSVNDESTLWKSAILEVDVGEINDAPYFTNLENRTLTSGDLFEYVIEADDEENNIPFDYNVEFLGEELFSEDNWSVLDNELNIGFVPGSVGSYEINFSVEDSNELGNETGWQVVNFSVQHAYWKEPLQTNFSGEENESFSLNLSSNVTSEVDNFTINSELFNISSEGVIDFIPDDKHVGYRGIDIIALSNELGSSREFNFNFTNINDAPKFWGLESAEMNCAFRECEGYENEEITLDMDVEDEDYSISEEFKEEYYEENLSLKYNITNESGEVDLFDFEKNVEGGWVTYSANFVIRDIEEDSRNYTLWINISDESGEGFEREFNLTIFNQDYDKPNITCDKEREFNFREGDEEEVVFSANHTVGDKLLYKVFIDGSERDSFEARGDGENFTWEFIPNYTDETYGEKVNLTLFVRNRLDRFSYLNDSYFWNLTIEHANAPIEFIDEIDDKVGAPYKYVRKIELRNHFRDVDNLDNEYNQSVNFSWRVNGSDLSVEEVSNWTLHLSSDKASISYMNITGCDIIDENCSTNITSNNFKVEFIEPDEKEIVKTVTVPGGGGGRDKIISLRIIAPGEISAYEDETITVPLQLVNDGENDFKGINLSSFGLKTGEETEEIKTSLEKSFFEELKEGEKKNTSLIISFNIKEKIGDYEARINLSAKSPKYKDWEGIHINLQRINESTVRELIVFTEELLAENPQCIEIKEVLDEAEKHFEKGDYVKAKQETKNALESCRQAISQVSVPKKEETYFDFSFYLILVFILMFVAGIVYYYLKRRQLREEGNEIEEVQKV